MTELQWLSAAEIAERCGVDVSTARRWKRGATQIPKAPAMILAGDLGCLDPAWTGWVLRDGLLCSPENWTATVGEVMTIPLVNAQLVAYQAENRALRAQIDDAEMARFEAQPLPDSMPAMFAKK